ncbi:hypothetical protein CLV47_1307 [Antricoccus suffuscus]|uniref:Uncharacterized protein n=1 Tax=Antricoccus suffuscus TaxID=1629062 RepID=A0A2T0Z2D2_9ACTN|nr:hypothetical protein [Antricoccus suffuscus]PRZ30493.1 hypothetical protein CLV47_1307 [Antricoccus suffuscus]
MSTSPLQRRALEPFRGAHLHRLVGKTFIAAPIGLLLAWVVQKGIWKPNFGLPWVVDWTAWTVSHLLYAGAIVLFAVVALELYRMVARHSTFARNFALVALGITVASLVAFLCQVLLDLTVSFGAENRSSMPTGFADLRDRYPVIIDLVQGPLAMVWLVGILALAILATITHAVRWHETALLTIGALLLLPQSSLLGTVGGLCVVLALAPIGRRMIAAAR